MVKLLSDGADGLTLSDKICPFGPTPKQCGSWCPFFDIENETEVEDKDGNACDVAVLRCTGRDVFVTINEDETLEDKKPVQKNLNKAKEMDIKVLTKIPKLSKSLIDRIPGDMARQNKFIPIKYENEILTIAMVDPLDIYVMDNLKFIVNSDVDCVCISEGLMKKALDKYYPEKEDAEDGSVIGDGSWVGSNGE